MVINESVENYLEAILMLGQKNDFVRSIDVVHELGFSKPSVSIAMNRLAENGYVNIGDHGHLTLTEKGLEIAEATYEKHELMTTFLINIGVPEEIAAEDACKMEHAISKETLKHLKNFLAKVDFN